MFLVVGSVGMCMIDERTDKLPQTLRTLCKGHRLQCQCSANTLPLLLHSSEANVYYAGTYQVYQQTHAVLYLVGRLLVLADDQPSAAFWRPHPTNFLLSFSQLEIISEVQKRKLVFACDLLCDCCDS